jgi:hypothetical protein
LKKEMIMAALKKISFKEVIRNLTMMKGFNEATVRTSFHRGNIGPDLARALHEVTSIHAAFWTDPENYDEDGKRRAE